MYYFIMFQSFRRKWRSNLSVWLKPVFVQPMNFHLQYAGFVKPFKL
jgi:hypothetical protein